MALLLLFPIKAGQRFTKRPEALAEYSTDASWFKITPRWVYFPQSVADIVNIVKESVVRKEAGEKVSLSVRAGGTCMSGGSLNEDMILDLTKHMKKVVVDPVAKTATVEMGAYFRDIEDEAAKHGLMFAAYPSSHRLCGIGGMIGNNASGEKSLRGGATSDNILELEVVLSDGSVQTLKKKSLAGKDLTETDKKIIELFDKKGKELTTAMGDVKKAASGYRLDKVIAGRDFSAIPLFAGSQGTLGIITKAVLQLSPIPKHTELAVVSAKQLADLPQIVNVAFEHNPESLETFDINTFNKAKEHLAEHAKHFVPYIDETAELFILAQFSEDAKAKTKERVEVFTAKLKEQGFKVEYIKKPLDVASAWQLRRNSFTLMRDYNAKGERAVPCIEDVIVPVPALGEFIAELLVLLEKYTEHYGFHGHIGDGSLRIIPVFDFKQKTAMDNMLKLMDEVFALVKKVKGNISADHSDGIIRTPFLKDFYGADLYKVFKDIKTIYDPHGIMNANKKVGGTKKMIEKYFIK